MGKVDLELIGKRLTHVRGKQSREKFAKKLGIHKNTLANYENGDRPFGADVLFSLLDLGFNPMWILSGEGSEFRSDSESHKTELSPPEFHLQTIRYLEKDQKPNNKILDPILDSEIGSKKHRIEDPACGSSGFSQLDFKDSFANIPLYNVTAAAGNGAEVDDEEIIDSLVFKKEWIHSELRTNPAHLYLIYVEGESMEPSLRPGDVILVDHSDNTANRDAIYVLRLDGALLVKRLQRLPGKKIKVSSDNPAYESFEIDLAKTNDDLAIIGRVVWTGRRL